MKQSWGRRLKRTARTVLLLHVESFGATSSFCFCLLLQEYADILRRGQKPLQINVASAAAAAGAASSSSFALFEQDDDKNADEDDDAKERQ